MKTNLQYHRNPEVQNLGHMREKYDETVDDFTLVYVQITLLWKLLWKLLWVQKRKVTFYCHHQLSDLI